MATALLTAVLTLSAPSSDIACYLIVGAFFGSLFATVWTYAPGLHRQRFVHGPPEQVRNGVDLTRPQLEEACLIVLVAVSIIFCLAGILLLVVSRPSSGGAS